MIRISSVLIGVKDLKKSRPFYEQLLGLAFQEFRPPFASASLDGLEFNIEEDAEYRKPEWKAHYIGGRKNISFEVDDLEVFLKKAAEFGAKIVQDIETKPWGWYEAVIADIDGNEFIVEQEI